MEQLSRRIFCGAVLAATAAPVLARRQWVKCADGSIVKSGSSCLTSESPSTITTAGSSSTTAATTTATTISVAYESTLGSTGVTPKYPYWNNRQWSAAMRSTSVAGLDYCWRKTTMRSRFEIRPGETRSELHESRTKLPNGVAMWGAFSYRDTPWPNPAGMLAETGGCFIQMHWPGSGSPAFAFRRGRDGRFVITTRGDGESNMKRYEQPMSFGAVHDIVYRFVLGPQGALDVWLDGKQILSFRGPVGSSTPGCYLCIGAYYAGGTGGNVVVQEYGNHVFPSTTSLSGRAASPPAWPTN